MRKKLTAYEVEHIRHFDYLGIPQTALARQFGISQASISHIVNGRQPPTSKCIVLSDKSHDYWHWFKVVYACHHVALRPIQTEINPHFTENPLFMALPCPSCQSRVIKPASAPAPDHSPYEHRKYHLNRHPEAP